MARKPKGQNDPLFPFREAHAAAIGGEPYTTLPPQAIERLVAIAAEYHAEATKAIRKGQNPPSLDVIAGLSGTKSTPWKKEQRRFQAQLFRFYFEQCVDAARQDPPIETGLAIRAKRYFPEGQGLYFTDGRSNPVPILDKRNRPTQEFQVALGRFLRVVPHPDHVTKEAIYRSVRRLLREARIAQASSVDK